MPIPYTKPVRLVHRATGKEVQDRDIVVVLDGFPAVVTGWTYPDPPKLMRGLVQVMTPQGLREYLPYICDCEFIV